MGPVWETVDVLVDARPLRRATWYPVRDWQPGLLPHAPPPSDPLPHSASARKGGCQLDGSWRRSRRDGRMAYGVGPWDLSFARKGRHGGKTASTVVMQPRRTQTGKSGDRRGSESHHDAYRQRPTTVRICRRSSCLPHPRAPSPIRQDLSQIPLSSHAANLLQLAKSSSLTCNT